MKKRLTKIVLAASLLSMPALSMADDEYTSLFGIEGGYSAIDLDVNPSTDDIQTDGFGNVGLKIGAESEEYRVFLSARYYDAEDFTKFYTIGAEVQYKFNFAKKANFFIGANIGKAFAEIAQKGATPSADISSGYVGGDAGFNFHVTPMIDFEIGARYMYFNEDFTQGTYTYEFNSLSTGYASIIIRWKED
jgi:hypothetical protein